MYKNFLRYLISAIFLITFSISAKADFKVGFVYIGPTGDHGWTYQHDEGRKAVEAAGIKLLMWKVLNMVQMQRE